jgi:hypothetical protein
LSILLYIDFRFSSFNLSQYGGFETRVPDISLPKNSLKSFTSKLICPANQALAAFSFASSTISGSISLANILYSQSKVFFLAAALSFSDVSQSISPNFS